MPLSRLRYLLLFCFCCLSGNRTFAQFPTNLGFERKAGNTGLPAEWSSGEVEGYKMYLDSLVRQEGSYSLRLQSAPDAKAQSFKAFSFVIPANFSGKEIELSGYIKTSFVTGYAGLWMRIDGTRGVLEFDNMQKQNIKGTADWKLYSIKLKLPKDGEQIYIGGLLSGEGTVWFDNLTLKVDGADMSAIKLNAERQVKALQDTAFRKGTTISLGVPTKQQIANLAVLGRVWGFLKYHHPAVAAGDYNWDNELFRILPSVLEAASADERSKLLTVWLDKLGPLPADKGTDTSRIDDVVLTPDLRWLNDNKLFSPTLSLRLNEVYQHRNSGRNYYISLVPGVQNPQFQHEDTYPGMNPTDGGLRMLSLFRYWNIIQYFFPYRHLIKEDWPAVLDEFIPVFAMANTAEAYTLATMALIARVQDSHAGIWGNSPALDKWKGLYRAPVQARFVDNQAVVTGYYHPEKGAASGLKTGDVITHIDKQTIADWVKQKFPYYQGSNEPTRLRNMAQDLLRGSSAEVDVSITRDGKPMTLAVKRYLRNELPMNLNLDWMSVPHDTSFRMLPGSIGLIFPARIKNSHVPAIQKATANAKGIIVDMRCYPADFIVFTLGNYFVDKPTPFVKFSYGSIANPGLFMMSSPLNVGKKGGAHFPGKVVILVNELSQSNAEYTTMAFRASPNVVVVGSQTAGADGNISQFYLPGAISTAISGIGVYYPDGRETQRIGIVPDVMVKPTIEGIRSGHDELMRKAIDIINESGSTKP
ncbi:S41 family peptidase [Arsenicibacter rosenii]|uniref:Tail specific protease domain-containing protein n=1 Tax=Arsenicibacter rosenii TaxID=1750698 RepID=A0A1S2VFJ3_9BACT|nr:S41 family peptidase [Arsenicibacter rosenii]OIN57479.1 hypothetical protein BLX24_19820 [Arsenicibacter rosenii]